jgi:hypothetical protein
VKTKLLDTFGSIAIALLVLLVLALHVLLAVELLREPSPSRAVVSAGVSEPGVVVVGQNPRAPSGVSARAVPFFGIRLISAIRGEHS